MAPELQGWQRWDRMLHVLSPNSPVRLWGSQGSASCFLLLQFQDNKRPSLDAGTSEPEGTHLLPVFIPFL